MFIDIIDENKFFNPANMSRLEESTENSMQEPRQAQYIQPKEW